MTLPPGSVAVAILSAADAERPLAEAARAQTRKDSIETMHGERDTLQEALAAPAGVKAQMEAVAGPTAVLEPDMVLIFGGTLTLAGFPPWAVRTSELFDVGRLGEVTGSKLDAALRRYLGTRQRFGR